MFIYSKIQYTYMAHVKIEYNYTDRPLNNDELRRKTTGAMEAYLMSLVTEMKSADIDVTYISNKTDASFSTLTINGKSVYDILNGLNIIMPSNEEDEGEECGTVRPKMVVFDRPTLDWKKDFVEDIPDILMKNAISKAYSES